LRDARQSEQLRPGAAIYPEGEQQEVERGADPGDGGAAGEQATDAAGPAEPCQAAAQARRRERRPMRREQSEQPGLSTENQQHRSEKDRQPAQRAEPDPMRRDERQRAQDAAERNRDDARQQQRRLGAQQQQQLQMAPAVGPRLQFAGAEPRPVAGRRFDDRPAGPLGPQQHFAGEFHAGRTQPELSDARPAERAKSGLAVGHVRSGQQPQQQRQGWCADIAMKRRHRARNERRTETGADDEIGAGRERGKHLVEPRQIVGTVGVGDDDRVAPGGANAGGDRRAIATPRLVNDARSGTFGDDRAVVAGAVVDDDDFAVDAGQHESEPGFGDDAGHGVRFVKAWQHDRHERHRQRLVVVVGGVRRCLSQRRAVDHGAPGGRIEIGAGGPRRRRRKRREV
jgi:hypothetical protein